MAKTKYYYTDENGIERLARTSNNVYYFYCDGACSKTYDGALKGRKRNMDFDASWIKHYEWLLEDDERIAKRYSSKSIEEATRMIKEALNVYRESYEHHSMQKVYKLYTK